jgi:radical SAM superfamily enzyme YgiQ (UPF0313 family)
MIALMEKAGVYSLGIGIESGSDKILKLLHKNLDIRQIEKKVGLIKRISRIRVTGFFLIGHPDETEEDILKTIRFARRLKIDSASFSPLLPLPGSALYDEWKKKVDIPTVDWSRFLYYQFVPHISEISSKRLEALLKKANMSFYLRPRILIGFLGGVKTLTQFKILLKRAARILRWPLRSERAAF